MKSKVSTKNKKALDQENKKPPVKQVEKENEKEEQPPTETKEITEEIEKKMLEGQEHIEGQPPEQSQEAQDLGLKEPQKKQMLIKPRETYLQEKISKMNPNKNLMSNIKKDLDDKVKTIINEENVPINEVTKDLNQYIKKEDIVKNPNENFINKQKYKEVKKLNDELMLLKKKFHSIRRK